MADLLHTLFKDQIDVRYKDVGDGTHALVISFANGDFLFDEEVGGLIITDSVHNEVHEGMMFQASYRSPDASDVADNGTLDLLVRVGADNIHTAFEFVAGGDAEHAIYEGTTVTDSNFGTALSENNMNRGSIITTDVQVTHTPTINSIGTLLHNMFLPGGTGGQALGASIRTGTEWILAANTTYLLRLINRAGTAQPLCIVLQWYT